MSYRSLESMIRNVLTEGLIDEASLGDSRGLMALAKRKRGDEKDVMMRAADMMKKGQIKDLNMFMKAMDQSTHKLIMPFFDKKHHKALHEDLDEAVKMCSEECCGKPVTECKCAPDCEHCDCNAVNEAVEEEIVEEAFGRDALQKKYEKITKDKTGETVQQRQDWYKKNAEAVKKRMQQQDEARGYGEADTHIIMQLRSAQDLDGKKDITFRGGAKAKVDKKHIDKILKLHDHPAIKPVQKRQMRVAISKSPKHLAQFANKLKMEDYSLENEDVQEKFANPAQQAAVMAKLKASGKYKKEEAHLDETKGAPKGYHFTRSGQLKKGDASQDGDGGAMLRSDPLDKQRKKIPPLPESDEDGGAPKVSTPRADYKLGKVRLPNGRMVYRKVKKQVDIEK